MKRRSWRASAVLLLGLLLLNLLPQAVSASSSPQGWQAVRAMESRSTLFAVIYAGGRFVAVGANGTVRTSFDARTWTSVATEVQEGLVGIAYGNGLYVAVGSSGTILTSPDAVRWTLRSSPVSTGLNGVAFGEGRFVAVGRDGVILTSEDGETWTRRVLETDIHLNAVGYGNGRFLAVGHRQLGYESDDGIRWTQSLTGDNWSNLDGVFFGYNRFYVVGNSGAFFYHTSEGWEKLAVGTQQHLRAMTVHPVERQMILVGANGTLVKRVPGTDTLVDLGVALDLHGVIYAAGQYVVVGAGGLILTSTDGSLWTQRVEGRAGSLPAIAYGDGIYVAGSDAGDLLTSKDGLQWTRRYTDRRFAIVGLSFGQGRFVALGADGATRVSTDGGVSWVKGSLGQGRMLGIAHDGSQFLALGNPGSNLYTSTDGLSWRRRLSDGGCLTSAVKAEERLVTVGCRQVGVKEDGSAWRQVYTTAAREQYNSVAYGEGRFVAVGNLGIIAHSEDGLSWQAQQGPTGQSLTTVSYGNGYFVAASVGGEILLSRDGLTWEVRQTSGDPTGFSASLFDGKRFLLTGKGGTILLSAPGFPETSALVQGFPTGRAEWAALGQTYYVSGKVTAPAPIETVELEVLGVGVVSTLSPGTTEVDLHDLSFEVKEIPPGDYPVNLWVFVSGHEPPSAPAATMTLKVGWGEPPDLVGLPWEVQVRNQSVYRLEGRITSETVLTAVTANVVRERNGRREVVAQLRAEPNATSFDLSAFSFRTGINQTYTVEIWAKSVGFPDPEAPFGIMTVVSSPVPLPAVSGLEQFRRVTLGSGYTLQGTVTGASGPLSRVRVTVEGGPADGYTRSFTPGTSTFDLNQVTIPASVLGETGVYQLHIWAETERYREGEHPLATVVIEVQRPGQWESRLQYLNGYYLWGLRQREAAVVYQGESVPLQGVLVAPAPLEVVNVVITRSGHTVARQTYRFPDSGQVLSLGRVLFDTTEKALSVPGTYELTFWALQKGKSSADQLATYQVEVKDPLYGAEARYLPEADMVYLAVRAHEGALAKAGASPVVGAVLTDGAGTEIAIPLQRLEGTLAFEAYVSAGLLPRPSKLQVRFRMSGFHTWEDPTSGPTTTVDVAAFNWQIRPETASAVMSGDSNLARFQVSTNQPLPLGYLVEVGIAGSGSGDWVYYPLVVRGNSTHSRSLYLDDLGWARGGEYRYRFRLVGPLGPLAPTPVRWASVPQVAQPAPPPVDATVAARVQAFDSLLRRFEQTYAYSAEVAGIRQVVREYETGYVGAEGERRTDALLRSYIGLMEMEARYKEGFEYALVLEESLDAWLQDFLTGRVAKFVGGTITKRGLKLEVEKTSKDLAKKMAAAMSEEGFSEVTSSLISDPKLLLSDPAGEDLLPLEQAVVKYVEGIAENIQNSLPRCSGEVGAWFTLEGVPKGIEKKCGIVSSIGFNHLFRPAFAYHLKRLSTATVEAASGRKRPSTSYALASDRLHALRMSAAASHLSRLKALGAAKAYTDGGEQMSQWFTHMAFEYPYLGGGAMLGGAIVSSTGAKFGKATSAFAAFTFMGEALREVEPIPETLFR
ncbi:MAG: WD40/YVTN/BNR-like repeat-containing protein [Bacillota bacterium]